MENNDDNVDQACKTLGLTKDELSYEAINSACLSLKKSAEQSKDKRVYNDAKKLLLETYGFEKSKRNVEKKPKKTREKKPAAKKETQDEN